MDINCQNYKRYTTIDILEEAGSEDAKSIDDSKKLLRGLHVVLEASVLSWGTEKKKKKKETKHIRKKKLCLLPSPSYCKYDSILLLLTPKLTQTATSINKHYLTIDWDECNTWTLKLHE